MLLHIAVVLTQLAISTGVAELQLTSISLSGSTPVERGKTTELYCDYFDTQTIIKSVQWVKYDGEKKIPVYSYIQSEVDMSRGPLEGRAELRHKYGRFTLMIHNVDLDDEGLYQCTLFQSFFNQLTSEKYALEVSIPAAPPTIEARHHENRTLIGLHCHGNVGRPGGSLTLYTRWNQADNWTLLESYEIQRVYANHTVTTYVRSSITNNADIEQVHVRCEAKNEGDNERVFATEKFIVSPPFLAGGKQEKASESRTKEESFHIAGITTLAFLAIAILVVGFLLIRRFTNVSLTQCIKEKRRNANQPS